MPNEKGEEWGQSEMETKISRSATQHFTLLPSNSSFNDWKQKTKQNFMQTVILTLNVQLNLVGAYYYSLHVPNSCHLNWEQLYILQYLSCGNFLDLSEQLFPNVPINQEKHQIKYRNCSLPQRIRVLTSPLFYKVTQIREERGFHKKCTYMRLRKKCQDSKSTSQHCPRSWNIKIFYNETRTY